MKWLIASLALLTVALITGCTTPVPYVPLYQPGTNLSFSPIKRLSFAVEVADDRTDPIFGKESDTHGVKIYREKATHSPWEAAPLVMDNGTARTAVAHAFQQALEYVGHQPRFTPAVGNQQAPVVRLRILKYDFHVKDFRVRQTVANPSSSVEIFMANYEAFKKQPIPVDFTIQLITEIVHNNQVLMRRQFIKAETTNLSGDSSTFYKRGLERVLAAMVEEVITDQEFNTTLSRIPATAFLASNTPPRPATPSSPQKVPLTLTPPALTSPSPTPTSPTANGARWAVVIGISDYRDSRIESLRYAERDAEALHAWLTSRKGGRYAPSRVKLLTGKQATTQAMKDALYTWLRKAMPEDVVTIYFAGHGSPESPDTPDNLYLLSYDTDYDKMPATAFPMWDIETALKRYIKAKRVFVITDACHAAGVGQTYDIARRSGRGIVVQQLNQGIQNLAAISDGVCVVSACAENQLSQESEQWGGGHGVFTYYLIKGLKGEADFSKDQQITLGELTLYVSQEVRKATKNAQTPTVAGRYDPALTIGKK